MSEPLAMVKELWHHALGTLQDVSARAPGSPTTQALAVGALLGLVTYKLMKKRYRLPPGPFAWPLLGNILSMDTEEPFYMTLKRWADERYGPVITIYLGPVRCVTLNSADIIMEALVQRGSDFAGRPFLYSMHVTSEGSKDIVFSSYGPAWKLHRKIGLQAMRHYMLGTRLEEAVHTVFLMVVEKMCGEPGPFDPSVLNTALMCHLLHKLCFGEPRPFDDPSIKRLHYLLDSFFDELGNGVLEDVLPFLRYWPTKKFRKLCDLSFEFVGYVQERIEEHQRTFNPDNIRDLTDSILLAQSEAAREERAEVMAMFTDTHVRQTLTDLFWAGVDTSRGTLYWTMLFLAGHPEVQKRAQKEIDDATGSRLPGLQDRAQLQYTEAVLCEAMRLGSSAATAIPHETLCDTTVGGYDVPKGTMVLVNLWAVHHDPNTWDQPGQFRPERFLDNQGKLKSKLENLIPFSAGRRVCLGESVARAELLLVLSCLLKSVTISLPKGAVYDISSQKISISTHSAKPYKIVVTRR